MKNNEKCLIVLGAGPQQKPVYERAKSLGVKTLAIDYNPNAISFQLASDYITAQIKDSDECIDVLKKSNLNYAGVMTYGVEIAPVVSAIAEEFNLVSVPSDVAYKTTNKCARSNALEAQSIPIPKYEIINDFYDPSLKLPFVVKPSDNSGSRGVRLVRNLNEWEIAYQEALSLSSDGRVVVEEYSIGQEISIEGFMIEGEMTTYGFTDRNFINNDSYYPYFIEDGSSCPTLLSAEIVIEAKDLFSKAANALGVQNGPSKGDLIVTNDGVIVFEITSRLSPAFSILTPYVAGVDPLTEAIKWSLGLPVMEENIKPRFEKGMAHRYYFHDSGEIKYINGFKNLNNMPGVINVVQLQDFHIGDILDPVSYINRLFYIITIGKTREEAEYFASKALSSVTIKTE